MKPMKRVLSVLLCVLMLLPVVGRGTTFVQAASTRNIGTWEELLAWAKESSDNKGMTVKLTANISRPLGTSWTAKAKFAGTFDGGDHYISGLTGTNGLFATASGTIKNLSILDSSFFSSGQVAAFVGKASGTLVLDRCYTDAEIYSSTNNAAGFVGDGAGKSVSITNSHFAGAVGCTLRYASAFIGNQNSGPCVIENCLNTGSVYAQAANGNVAGFSEAVYNGSLTLRACVNLGEIRYGDNQTGFSHTRTVRDGGRVTTGNCYNLTGAADSKTYALQGTATLNGKKTGSDFSAAVTDITSADYAAVAATLGSDWSVEEGRLLLQLGLPTQLAPEGGEEEPELPDDGMTVVLGASDFQSYEDAHNTCRSQMGELLEQIKGDYPQADGLLFAGDYYHQYSTAESEKGILAMTQTVVDADMGISESAIVKVQGNHDERGTVGLSPSGDNDPASGEYGVFVINEDDYMWFAGSGAQNGSEAVSMHEQTVKNTAAKLRSYLEAKAQEDFSRPIFVVSHLPLHYSMRTYVYGDARYARYLFDQLNYGASLGLNIIFLFGHDHSHGWDNHLGGAAIYLERGETINIGVTSDPAACTQEVLGFTYLNAGYVGYFTTDNGEAVDMTMTMTVFAISDDEVVISRYDANGLHLLKSEGASNGNRYDGMTETQHGIFTVDSAPVSSPQSVDPVTAVIAPAKADCTTDGTLGYYQTASGACYTDLGLQEATTPQQRALLALGHRFENGACAVCGEAVGEYLLGDANGDGAVSFADIQRIYQHLSTQTNPLKNEGLLAADANEDETVNFSDIQRIYQHLFSDFSLF